MNKTTKKRLLVVGGVAALGYIGYYLYTKSQESSGALPPPTPTPAPLPKPQTSSPSSGKIAAYQAARSAYDTYVSYLQTNPPKTQAEVLAAQQHLQSLRTSVLAAANAAGLKPSDIGM